MFISIHNWRPHLMIWKVLISGMFRKYHHIPGVVCMTAACLNSKKWITHCYHLSFLSARQSPLPSPGPTNPVFFVVLGTNQRLLSVRAMFSFLVFFVKKTGRVTLGGCTVWLSEAHNSKGHWIQPGFLCKDPLRCQLPVDPLEPGPQWWGCVSFLGGRLRSEGLKVGEKTLKYMKCCVCFFFSWGSGGNGIWGDRELYRL